MLPCSSRTSTRRPAELQSAAHLTPTLTRTTAPGSTAAGTSHTTTRVACASIVRSRRRRLRGRVRSGDEAVHVPFAEAVLLKTAGSFAARVKTRDHLAAHVDDLMLAVDAQTAVGVVPDDHDRKRVERRPRDTMHRRVGLALEVRILAAIDVAVPLRDGRGE